MDDNILSRNTDRCIGYGLCVIICPIGALSLKRKEEKKLRKPPLPKTYKFMKSSNEYNKNLKNWINK
ncbi:MAG: 4Fe-4S binding protein [Promethearchaeota archaeon]